MLVEFFGTHDFGWLREDSTVPMTFDGILTVPDGTIGAVCYIYISCFLLLFIVDFSFLSSVFSLPQSPLCVICL
jgi:hypothetical protein